MDIRTVFTSIPGSNVLLLPDAPRFTIVGVSDDYLKITKRNRYELMGRGLFELFPNNPEDLNKTSEKTVQASLEYALSHKEAHHLPLQRYDIPIKDSYEERYWVANNQPILNEAGEVIYLIHHVEDVTVRVKAEQRSAEIKSIEKAYSLFMQAPTTIALVKGEQHILELANGGALALWGKTKDIIGKPLKEGIPEIAGQGTLERLNKVLKTGQPYMGKEVPIATFKNGKKEVHYFDMVYQPYYEDGEDKPSGVFTQSHDVTEMVLARQKVQESEEKYRGLFESMDQAFCVIEVIFDGDRKPVNYRFLETNPAFEKQAGLVNANGKTVRELVPGIENHWFELYGSVVLTGESVRFVEESKAMNRWFEVHAFRIGGEDRRNVGIFFTDITRRKKAEEALRQSEDRLKKVLSIETVGVIYFDLEGGINDANDAFQRMSGFTREDFVSGKVRWDQVTPPEFMEATLKSREELLTKGQNTPYEKQYIRPDGSRWWGLFAGKRLSESECVEFVVDITEQKKIQHALMESESNLRNMILHAPVAMCILTGSSFTVELANERMFEVWGKGPDIMVGKPVFEGLPEALNQGLEELLQHVYHTGETFSASERPIQLPRHGRLETAYINFVFEPFRSGDGIITGVIAVAIDVTEQVVARMKVEKANKELQFVMDFMPQMVWSTFPDGNADFFNQVYLEYTGLPMEQLVGYQWTALIHPDDAETSVEVWKQALARKNGEYVIEHRLRGRDGSYRWFLTRGVPLRDENSKILKWYGTTTDIQEQKSVAELLEQRVQERTRELELRNKELEQFAHVSHHDLQEPLRKIILFSDMVKADSYDRLTEASQKRLDRVMDAARRMSAALKDVLNFASLNKEEHYKPVDLDEVLASVQSDLELAIHEKGAKIHSDELPTIKAVPQQMHQLLYNLVNNALKFSKQGQVPVINITCIELDAVEIKQHPELKAMKRYYLITVQDNGIGFSQDAAHKIFVMFQRLHSKDAYAGTGIGLALCKKVVQNHGGKIWAESNEGAGATFKIVLPED